LSIKASIVNGTLKLLTGIGCRIDSEELGKVPMAGPLILVSNHTNFLETPVVIPRLANRPITALAKVESWKSPLFSYLFNIWDFIPIRRGEADLDALNKCVESLQAGKILIVLPEGTRSSKGILQTGHPGVLLMALRSGAPILPLAHYGGEDVWGNLKHFRRTPFTIRVGRKFYLNTGEKALSREVRKQAMDEIMYQIAALLPEENRGPYSDTSQATQEYIRFEKED
jgi:1-acyl-sn-glycerol-3-phosphate acyltransferase